MANHMLSLSGLQLMDAAAGLRAIGSRVLPARTAYAIVRAKRQAELALGDLEAARVKLCESHAAKGEDDKPAVVDGKYQISDPVAFDADWRAVLAEPVQLAGVRAISLEELSGVSITPDELLQLGPFVSEPTDDA